MPGVTTNTTWVNDDKVRDEFRCPAGQSNPSSMGFTLKQGGNVFTGTARFANGIMTEFAGTMTGTGFELTTYGTNSGSSAYKGQGSIEGAPKPINPKPPPVGARIGNGETTTIQAYMETNARSRDFGALKTYQYRIGNNPNVFVDLKKIENELKAKRKKHKKADDEEDEDSDLSANEQLDDSGNAYESSLMEHGRKLVEYQSCCPNENIPACRKKIRAANEAAEAEEAARSRPIVPQSKPQDFKDNSPFTVRTR